jgi:23S rRNA pseudouridine1911/1915/1917 synthase
VTLAERLRELYPGTSRRSLKHWVERGRVTVNGQVARDGRAPVSAGDRVSLGGRGGTAAFPPDLGRVHEDEDLIVVDKPSGLLTIATESERRRTLYRQLWTYLEAQRPPRRPFIVHRLDRETSGLLVVAKSVAAKRHLQAQFEARAVERVYLAVVEGRVEPDEGTLESRLRQDRALRVRAGRSGRLAITHYRVLERRRDTTVLELRLGTGRRHQIRVQLAESDHPIVGDRASGARRRAGRLHLHATRLRFVHPRTGAPLRFESKAPAGWV